MKKFISVFICVMLVLTTLVGCNNETQSNGGNEPSENTAEEQNNESVAVKDSIVFALTSEPKSLDPSAVNEYTSFTVDYQIYNFLVGQKSNGELFPELAKSWEISEDGKEVTFYLREGVKFHNGDEMTAEDVAFSINKAVGSPITAGVTSAIDSAEILDKYIVKVKLKFPFGPIISCMPYANMAIISKRAYEEDPEGFCRNPIGTGPYKFVEWKIGEEITLERFDDYFEGAAAIKDLKFKIILDSDTAVIALENGEIDIFDTPPAAGKKIIIDNKDLQYQETAANGTTFVMMHNSKGKFADKKIRQAIGYAIDKEAVIVGALEGNGKVAETLMGPGCFGYPNGFKSKFEYNFEKAKELLKEAGYPDGFEVSMPTMDVEYFIKPTEVVQDQLRKIGINAEIEKYERGVWLDKTRTQHDYEITVMNTNAPYPDGDYLYPLMHSDYIESGKNWAEVRIPELDQLLEKQRNSTDESERIELLSEICKVMDENMVIVPLYNNNMAVAARANLNGVIPSSTRRHFVYDFSW